MTKRILMSFFDRHFINREMLVQCGYQPVMRGEEYDFLYCDEDVAAERMKAEHPDEFPEVDALIDKLNLHATLKRLGLPSLECAPVSNEDDIRNFPTWPAILKPRVWSGSKTPTSYTYRIYPTARAMIAAKNKSEYELPDEGHRYIWFKKGAFISEAVRNADGTTDMLYVNGGINGIGDVYFDSISEKVMRDNVTIENIKNPKSGNLFGIYDTITAILAEFAPANTPFKVQAVVRDGVAYITDWSWTYSTYYYPEVLDWSYAKGLLDFIYDVTPTNEKPIDKVTAVVNIDVPNRLHGKIYEYAKQRGVHYRGSAKHFWRCVGDSEQEVREKIATVQREVSRLGIQS